MIVVTRVPILQVASGAIRAATLVGIAVLVAAFARKLSEVIS